MNLKESSNEWSLCFELAAADRGIIPQGIIDDGEQVKELPAFFGARKSAAPLKVQGDCGRPEENRQPFAHSLAFQRELKFL